MIKKSRILIHKNPNFKSFLKPNKQKKEIIKMNFLTELQKNIDKKRIELKNLENEHLRISNIKYKESSKEKEESKKLRDKIKLKEMELDNRKKTLEDKEKDIRDTEDNITKLKRQRDDFKKSISVKI